MSTLGQDLDAQLAALAAEGVKSGHVFTDKLSGVVTADRPGLTALLHYAREGDTLVPAPNTLDPNPRCAKSVPRGAETGEKRAMRRNA